jgi:uncharacterized protein involved in outer membrane biogenesis
MKTLQLAFLLMLSVIVLIVIAVVSAPTFIDWRSNKGIIESLISDYTGLRAKIEGDLQVQILPNPKLYAENITFESISGQESIAKVGHVILTKDLSEILSLDFSIDQMVINRPQVNLVLEEDGNKNWEPVKVKSFNNYYGSKLKSLMEKLYGFNSLTIENGSILYTDVKTGLNKDISNIYINGLAGADQTVNFNARGLFETVNYSLDLKLEKRTATSAKIDAKINSAKFVASLQGLLSNMYNFNNITFNGKSTLTAADANYASKLIFKDLSDYVEFKNLDLETEINVSKNKLDLDINKFKASNKNLKGDVVVEKNGAKTNVNLNLSISRFDIKQREVAADKKPGKIEWSDNPLDFSFLNNMGFNIDIDCTECIYGKKSFRDANLNVFLENSNLIVRNLSVKSDNGGFLKFSATAGLNSPLAVEAKSEASQFPLPTLLASIFNSKADFNLNGTSSVLATGVSPKAMVSNLSGTFKYDLENVKLNNIKNDSLKVLIKELIKTNPTHVDYNTELGNIKLDGVLRDGVLRSSDIAFKFKGSDILSKGKFDIANLTMGYRIEPTDISRSNLGVVLSGNINKLEVIEDKITPKGVVDGFGRLVTTQIVKQAPKKQIKTPFDYQDRANLDENVRQYLFEEK